MRVSIAWLRELLPDLKAKPDEIATRLTQAGIEVENKIEVGVPADDLIFELGLTPNRADLLSHRGVARELAALFNLKLKTPKIRDTEQGEHTRHQASVRVESPALCPVYRARVLSNVAVGPSPQKLKDRLTALGLRSVSNVVDITNYVLMELGQPLHAFDLDKLTAQQIVVRTAQAGESLTLLDGVTVNLHEEDLVIADQTHPVALAGVMGGQATEVTATTQRILLESAFFAPTGVRKTAKRHSLHTDASHRFERGVDSQMIEVALDRAAELMTEFCGAVVHRGLIGSRSKLGQKIKSARVRPERVQRVLGISLAPKQIRSYLHGLGLKSEPTKGASKKSSAALAFQIPSWRVDISTEEDLIEELARMHGYDQIPAVMPRPSETPWNHSRRVEPEREVRHVMRLLGFHETINLAFGPESAVTDAGLQADQAVSLLNPLGAETAVMRPALWPSLLRALRLNQDHLPAEVDVRMFEIGRVFQWGPQRTSLPEESNHLAAVWRGARVPQQWQNKAEAADVFDLKGTLESLLQHLALPPLHYTRETAPGLHPVSATALYADNLKVGFLGELHPEYARRYGLAEGPRVFMFELALDRLLQAKRRTAKYQPLPKFPPASRDLSFFVDQTVSYSAIREAIFACDQHGLLENLGVFDVYQGRGVPGGQKSIAISMVLRSAERTLAESEIEAFQTSIVDALRAKFSISLRAAS